MSDLNMVLFFFISHSLYFGLIEILFLLNFRSFCRFFLVSCFFRDQRGFSIMKKSLNQVFTMHKLPLKLLYLACIIAFAFSCGQDKPVDFSDVTTEKHAPDSVFTLYADSLNKYFGSLEQDLIRRYRQNHQDFEKEKVYQIRLVFQCHQSSLQCGSYSGSGFVNG